ncbi:thioesterase family protein [Niveispirillum sp. SYP-B3756]|uniref:acyl-CoA thioesterase n=1 Tax=Niveispirillum sp. SYP-B3756 TaxID=2662178 RepID=UPI00156309DF|nr:thioesterase family protein [Niveispirillum sp. SYP-B3756]
MIDLNLLRDPARFRHWVQDHVRFGDLDPLGHANNNAINIIMENGRVCLTERLEIRPLLPDGLMVIKTTRTEFNAEVHRPARLDIGVGIGTVGTSSFSILAGLFVNGTNAATHEAWMVLIDRQTRRPTPLPPEARAILANNIIL